MSEGLLCAVINNNTRCYNESTEFADHLDDALAAPYKVILHSLPGSGQGQYEVLYPVLDLINQACSHGVWQFSKALLSMRHRLHAIAALCLLHFNQMDHCFGCMGECLQRVDCFLRKGSVAVVRRLPGLSARSAVVPDIYLDPRYEPSQGRFNDPQLADD